jgi:hypothetical protein
MRNLRVVIVSGLLLTSLNTAYGQFFRTKYVRKNKDAPITVYGDSGMYSRGIHVDTTLIYFGSSDGSVRSYNLNTKASKLLIKLSRGLETRDLAVSNGVLFAMQSGKNGMIAKLSQNGNVGFIEPKEWNGLFFDAMDFNNEVGFLMGDPKGGYFSLYHTKDGGRHWKPCLGKVRAIPGEVGFAASGTNVHVANDSTYMFVSGGMRTNFYKSTDSGETWTAVEVPYYPAETIGAYSMCFSTEKNGVIVGGDYKQPELKMNTTYYTYDGGETWYNSPVPPGGYRSCVIFYEGIYYCCGQTGIDFSYDGIEWIPFAEGAFYALAVADEQLIATMKHGRFQSFELVEP